MTVTNQSNPPVDPEDRRKHLEFIQAVIARLSTSSATAKGWSLTLAAATFGFSAANGKWYIALIGCVVLIAFSVMDAYYLHSERLFRDLYEATRLGNTPSFSMDPHAHPTTRRRVQTYRTWSVLGFYGPLLLAGIVVTLILLFTTGGNSDKSDHTPPHGPDRHHHTGSH